MTRMEDLQINPKFRDLIPKLSDDEFTRLEDSILDEGEIRDPIIAWNGTIIDGHNRYRIWMEHKDLDLPYKIADWHFENEYQAMSWACANQLGRRNLTDEQRTYLVGVEYENEKLAHGAQAGNQNASKQSRQNDDTVFSGKRTKNIVAEKHGIGSKTVERAGDFAKGVNLAEEIMPGAKDVILSGAVKRIKSAVGGLPKATPEKQREAVESIMKASGAKEQKDKTKAIKAAKTAIAEKPPEPYNTDDLLEDIRANWKSCKRAINETVMDTHVELLETEEGNSKAQSGINEIISDLQELLEAIQAKKK